MWLRSRNDSLSQFPRCPQGTPGTMTCLLWPEKRPKIAGELFQKNWVGVCCTLPETLTLFQTKICDLPYPISDLIKNLIPYFRPEALEPGAWPERVTICYGTHTVVGVLKWQWSYRQMMKKKLILLKNIPNSRLKRTNHTLFQPKMVEIATLFQTKTAKKTIPFCAAHTYVAYVRDYPPPLP